MKKILFLIILAVLFIPVVKADRVYGNIGDYVPSGDAVVLSDSYDSTSISVIFYDGENEVCSYSDVDYSYDDGYIINCDKGQLWEYVSNDNNTHVFRKVTVSGNVYRVKDNDNHLNVVLKKGDIILHSGDRYVTINYPKESYSYSYNSLGNEYTALNNNAVVVGYEPTDWNKEIEGSIDKYLLVEYYYDYSDYYTELVFVPYKDPEFSIRCDKNILVKGEETDCYIEVDSSFNLENISFDLKSKVLGIKEYTELNDKYRLEVNDNNYKFILKATEDLNDSYPLYEYIQNFLVNDDGKEGLLKFRVVANENIDTTEVLSADDISYKIAFLDGSSEVSYEFVNNNKPVKNPETASNVVIAIVIAIVTITILVYLKNKRMTYDV